MSGALKVGLGSNLVYDGENVTVIALNSTNIRLRDKHGHETVMLLNEFLIQVATNYSTDESEEDQSNNENSKFPISGVPKESLALAEDRLAHLLEARTGYKSGSAELTLPGEPHPQYDPQQTPSLRERMAAKATELRTGQRSLWRQASDYDKSGLWGLIDKRTTKALLGTSRFDPRLLRACGLTAQKSLCE